MDQAPLWHGFQPPILEQKFYGAASVFAPEAMLREARRQKRLGADPLPALCVLDPDGDLLRRLQAQGKTRRAPGWACYHTEMFLCEARGIRFGIVGGAVGGSFSVLLAEQAFCSGCELLISLSSAGRIGRLPSTPCFVLIERALRDEGTSYHYLPPARHVAAAPALVALALAALAVAGRRIESGTSWTTDAPFRETAAAIAAARDEGVLTVEMEAASLYAFAAARRQKLLCFAQVTNQMGQMENDFEKGEANGAIDALDLILIAARAILGRHGGEDGDIRGGKGAE